MTLEQIAADFGVHPMTLSKWLRAADIEDGAKPGTTAGESAELRELRRRNRLLEQENEVLRRAAAYLSQAQPAGKRLYPLVKELAADGIPVAVTCRVLKLPRQPYYRWLANPVTDAELAEAYRANAIFDAHRDDPEFGYRFLVDEAARRRRADGRAHRVADLLRTTAGGARSARRSAARTARSARRSTTIWCAASSPPTHQISCGWPTLPNIAPVKASSTCARSRTCSPTGSSATRSTTG